MGLGALWFLHASRKRFEQKHEDYRALSEAFRVQFYLTVAQKKINVSEHYLQKHKGELEWVLYVLRASQLRSSAGNTSIQADENILKRYEFINTFWVKDQFEYYRKTSWKYHLLLKRLRLAANGMFLGALSAAILLFLFSTWFGNMIFSEKYGEELFHSILVVCTHSFLVISAALHGYIEKMIFAEQNKSYQQMQQLFHIAHDKLTRSLELENTEEAGEISGNLCSNH